MTELLDRMPLVKPFPTVLLVDDNEDLRKWIHDELEGRRYNLLEASNGLEASLIAEEHDGPIDIVVTDIVMPHVDGFELVDRLLQHRIRAKVVYISAYPQTKFRNPRLSLTNYLQKPFIIDTLISTMTLLLKDGG